MITPEAIEAAARAICLTAYGVELERMGDHGQATSRREATAALTAAYPCMEAQAKAEALREAADGAFKDKSIQGLQRTLIGTWLRARATTIESGAPNV